MLLALGTLALSIPLRAFAADDDDFNHLVGWANIFALPAGLAGIALWFLDRWLPRRDAALQLADTALDELAAQILAHEGRQRAALLGSDSPSTVAANVHYDQLVRFEEVGTDRDGDLAGIGAFYIDHTNGRLVILGTPGAGKTVLALELLLQLLERRHRCTDVAVRAAIPVPVRLNLPSWNTDEPFESWLIHQLRTQYGMRDWVAEALVRGRKILPILDGLDEMDPGTGNAVRARAAVNQLNQFLSGRTAAPLVVACRSADYARLGDAVRPAVQIGIRPLTAAQISHYLRQRTEHDNDPNAWQVWQPVLTTLARDAGHGLLPHINSPWRMMLAVTFQQDGGDLRRLLTTDGEADGPGSAYGTRISGILLERFIPARTRLCDPGRYRPEQVERWLCRIARHLTWQGNEGRSSADIVLHEWWPIAGDARVRRWHAIVAVVITVAMTVIAGLAVNDWDASYAINRVFLNITNLDTITQFDLLGGFSFLIIGFAFPYFVYSTAHQRSCEPARINLQQARTFRGRRRLVRHLIGGLAAGVAIGIAFHLIFGLAVGIALGLPNWVLVGLGGGLAVGLSLGLNPIGAVSNTPHDPIRNDFTVWLALSLAIALGFGLAVGLRVGAGQGVSMGLGLGGTCALVGGLATGMAGQATLRYATAIALVAWKGDSPWRLVKFLAWAYRAGLLRISGGAYQLRHNELRDWLQQTTRPPEEA